MSADLLGDLLRQVSRSFYLSLAVLPRPLREPIGLAYLLARAADTIADTPLVPRADRLGHLEALRRACAPYQAHIAERRLLERLAEALDRVAALPPADRHEVRAVLATLTSGMIFDLTRFPGEDAKGLAAIESLEELDHYTYLVAGCVGPFWTVLHVAHRRRLADWALREMSEQGVSFGKALQLTNVLRDVPGDLAHGRCYLPARELAALGLGPRDLLEPSGAARALPLYRRLIGLALEYYDVAWEYTLAVPRFEWRMRLACAWPLLIGLATLARLAAHPNPLAVGPIKISRGEVRALLTRSTLTVWSNRALAADAARLRARIAV
jgi:farnesyl-diphosphate farnesyltransferase